MRRYALMGLLFIACDICCLTTLGQNTLLIEPGDVLHIQVADTPEMDSEPRVTDQGTVPIIGAGNVSVSKLSPGEAAIAIEKALVEHHYLNHPEVSINVEEFATQQVSVLGEVKTSGAYQITTPHSILAVLALAGGLTPEADRNILIEREFDQEHPLHYYVSNNGTDAIQTQIMVNPGDTVIVPRAGIVYVLGDVNRPGGYVMSNNESQLTLLQALALAGGTTKSAKHGHAHLIRKRGEGSYDDNELSVVEIEKGKRPDLVLSPGDVLYIPFSFARNLANSGAATIAGAAAQASVYAIP